MARGSDLEKVIFGILNAIEGGQSASAADREYQLKLEDRNLARRKALGEERRSKIAEFADLGSPLEQIERGMETSEAPTFKGMQARGISIGQEPTMGERQDVSAYERFNKKLEGRGPGNDQFLENATRELGQLRELAAMGNLTPEQMNRMRALEEYADKRTGLNVPAAPKQDLVDAPREESPSDKFKRGVKKFRGFFSGGAEGPKKPFKDSQGLYK